MLPPITCVYFFIIVHLYSPSNCQSLQTQSQSQQPPKYFGVTGNEINRDLVQHEPTYFVLASKTLRPGQVYRVSVTVYRSNSPLTARASLQRNGVELASAAQECKERIPEILLLRVPPTSIPGVYKLRVEGNVNGVLGGTAFINETYLEFSQRSMTIFIATDKPIYMQGQTVRFRAIPITTDLKAFSDAIDIYMIDPKGAIMRRWLSRQSNLGAVSLEYPLSLQPVYGQNWTIRVVAQGQIEEKQFAVEEYYQTRFEVNVSMPAFFLQTDEYIYGSIMANFTSGVPVVGNLTVLYTLLSTRQEAANYFDRPAIETTERFFNGYREFRIPMSEIVSQLAKGSSLDGSKITVTAFVGERFLNLIYTGHARAYIFTSRVKLKFLGSMPQVFKPPMPFKAYAAVSFHDGSPLPLDRLIYQKLEIRPRVQFHRSGARSLQTISVPMSSINSGLWEISINLKTELNDKRLINDVQYLSLDAYFKDANGETIRAQELRAYATHAPSERLIHVSTSTKQPKVGEYIIFHVRANYYVKLFSYVIVSKGMVLMTGREEMTSTIKTFAVSLSPEMAPSSTIVIYDIARGGEVVSDSLTFPVDGISRNNFTVALNNQKDKTGDTLEFVVKGTPGTYVGLSALDKDLYSLQVGDQINYADVLKKMSTFDQSPHSRNGTLTHIWLSREGRIDRFVHFPSGTYGIDTNTTFEHAGLVIFTDANVTQRYNNCNKTQGFLACMDGTCYHSSKHCDGTPNCRDGTDEGSCAEPDPYNMALFRMSRTNRIQRLYDNSWLWKDINIGPLGYTNIKAPVPNIPVMWIVSAFGLSASHGFGLQQTSIEFSSVRPFYMNVEMPSICSLGEQIGVRISIFNYLPYEIEVIVVLARSMDYKFVHVESKGRVQSYSPRTSYGQHQHLVLIYPGKTSVVYMPIVAQRLGNINVTIIAKTQVAKDIVTKMIRVEADGIPQYTHTSVVLDLSQGAYLIKYLETNITESPIIPYLLERRYIFGSNKAKISVVGDIVGPSFPTMPMNASSILRKPFDCGEQNMFNFAMNVYTLFYLRLTGQRRSDLEKQAFKYLNIQYQRQLSYKNADGSFRAFRWNNKPSVWVTAFCARILHKATFQEWENFLYIDPSIIHDAIAWLLKYQTPEGAFTETSLNPYNRRMNLTGKFSSDYSNLRNISLTAHVLITLAEVRDLGGDVGSKAVTARTSAQRYLERMLHIIKNYEDPYELSIVTYALSLVNSVEAEEAFNLLDQRMREVSGMRYWGKEAIGPPKTQIENNRPFLLPRLPNKYDSSNIETTAYGLLVHIAKQAVIQREIVDWLNYQRLYDSGWASTQDTVVAYQALIEYAIQSRLREVTDITITLEAPSSRNFSQIVHIGEDNLSQLQEFNIPNPFGAIMIKAQGSGLAIVQLDVQYNVDWAFFQIEPPVRSFDLLVSGTYTGRNSSHITIRSCQRWTYLQESSMSGMTVLEVAIPTGYVIQQQELDVIIRTTPLRNLQEARFSERKVVFYFDYLDSDYTCVSFTVQRWYPVANLTRYLPVRVYDYYTPERFNETMFNTQNLNYLSICHVCGSYQCPYCPVFSGTSNLNANLITIFIFTVINLIIIYRRHHNVMQQLL